MAAEQTTEAETTERAAAKRQRQPVKLSAKRVEAERSNGKQRDIYDGKVQGLVLRISKTGNRKTWCLIYRIGKTKHRWTIGPADDERGAISLEKARRLAEAEKAKLNSAMTLAEKRQADPRNQKVRDRKAKTFSEAIPLFLAAKRQKARRPSTLREYERILNTVANKRGWKDLTLPEISDEDVSSLIGDIGGKYAANRTLSALGSFFSWAVKAAPQPMKIRINPCKLVERPHPEPRRKRVLDADEIRALWTALDHAKVQRSADDTARAPITAQVARLLQFLLVTAQRSTETANMRWADVELPDDWQTNEQLTGAWWTIPATETKTNREHRVWVSLPGLRLLREARAAAGNSEWVWASETRSSANVGIRSKRALAALRRAEAIKFDARRHDLRRTAATAMRAARVAREDVEMVLNHVGGSGAIMSYDHYTGSDEKQRALDVWALRLTAILADDKAKVLPFAR
jgi:integrase